MIGFVTTPEISALVTQAISDAQTSHGLPLFWMLIGMPIYSGKHTGKHFIQADEEILSTPLRGNPVLTPRDFPEFNTIIDSLGGLDARIDIPATDIIPQQL